MAVQDAQETGRPTAMLHIRPSAFGDRRHVEVVTLGDELSFDP
jgi:hypothetical protein